MTDSLNSMLNSAFGALMGDPRTMIAGAPTVLDVIGFGDIKNPVETFKVNNFDDKVVYTMDMPGVKSSDIEVECANNVMNVTGTRYSTEEPTEGEERVKIGVYPHVFKLKENADVKAIKASHVDGVLTITVPVKEESKPRVIKVEAK